YVEVLALGTWALWFTARWVTEEGARPALAFVAGLLLGLGFWCHILAVIHLVSVGLVVLYYGRRRAWRSWWMLGLGWVLGYVAGRLWTAGNHWGSFQYLVPGGPAEGDAETVGVGTRLVALVTDYWPVLLGYDTGYPPVLDVVVFTLGCIAGVL